MKRLLQILLWTVVAALGGVALCTIAFHRGEPINATWFVLAAACSYLVAYLLYSAFIAANSFSTMVPSVSRTVSTLIGVTLSAILAISGLADNLVGFFSIIAASFGPICGAMVAEYLLAKKAAAIGVDTLSPDPPAALRQHLRAGR